MRLPCLQFERVISKSRLCIHTINIVVKDKIHGEPAAWSEAVLGMNPAQYGDRMLNKATWGGAIELAIISATYKVEIDSVDVQSGRTDREFS